MVKEPLSPKEFVKHFVIKSLVYCLSGGKDSLVATHYCESELAGFDEWGIDKHFICVDTTVMIPDNIPWLRKVVKDLFDAELTILKPKLTFWEFVDKWGAPRMRGRWCCYHLKLEPIIRFMKQLKAQRAEITGLRREESVRRRHLRKHVIFKKQAFAWGYAPILDWTDKQVKAYIRKHNIPINPIYKTPIKETCVCGVFSTPRRIEALRALYPDLFAKFLEAEKRFRKKGAMFYFHYQPHYARDFLKQKLLSDYE